MTDGAANELATGLFARLGVVGIDHVAVTTRRFDRTLADYLSLPGARLARGPGWNAVQRVDFAFVDLVGRTSVEILGLRENVESPIETHVRRGGGTYHLCYQVRDLDEALKVVGAERGLIVTKPTQDVAFDGRRIAFFMHRNHGLVELVEAAPSSVTA